MVIIFINNIKIGLYNVFIITININLNLIPFFILISKIFKNTKTMTFYSQCWSYFKNYYKNLNLLSYPCFITVKFI